MWHLLQSFQQNYRSFWARLIGISLALHLFIVFIMFFYKTGDNIKLTVFSKKHDVEVVFLPIYKTIPNVAKKIAQSKKAVSAKKTISKKNRVVIPKSKPKSKVVPAKKSIKKVQPKKKVVAKKAVELKKKKKSVQKSKQKKFVKEQVQQKIEPIYVGRNDLKALEIAGQLQQAIAEYWHPPVGFPLETECEVVLEVGTDGHVKDFEIKKTSGILAYDMSVRFAIPKIIFPKKVNGKTLTIVFKQ